MTIEQAYSDLLLRIQNLQTLYGQIDSHVLNSLSMFWTIVIGVFAILGVALSFVAQRMVEKGIKKYSSESQLKIDDYEKRITTLEIELREKSNQMQADIDRRAKLDTGTYTGTGTYGKGYENRLIFPFKPKSIIIVSSNPGSTSGVLINPNVYGINIESDNDNSVIRSMCLTWEGNSVSWYNTRSALSQLNESKETYYYTVIG